MPDALDELYVYAMGRDAASFILQHVVDAQAAQTATADTKPIKTVLALIGLYLRVERHLSGRQVQQVHMRIGRYKRQWPIVLLPADRGMVTAATVLAAPPGAKRDEAIDTWCKSVWDAFRESRSTIIDLLRECGVA
jgi:hypothetical protein